MTRLNVLADDSILAPWSLLATVADVTTMPGREMTAADVRKRDVLIVRSITPVDSRLLDGSRVRLVGTATSGIDHIDTDYLQTGQIALVTASGSNANAVAEYCMAAVAEFTGGTNPERAIGVIGAGATGGRFIEMARGVGWYVCFHDPLLSPSARSHIERLGARAVDLRELLTSSNVVSLHVPLTRDGPCPTVGMLTEHSLSSMPDRTLLINTSRGEVLAPDGLRQWLSGSSSLDCAFDVWLGEPDIDRRLLERAAIATPHIAGYSREAKLAAGRMMVEGLARFAGVDPATLAWNEWLEHADAPITLDVDASDWREAVARVLPLPVLTAVFKERMRTESPAAVFDGLRRSQAQRHEFGHYAVRQASPGAAGLDRLRRLGFRIPAG